MTRFVLDASVLLSGTVARADSPPALLLDAVRRGAVEAVACPRLIAELQDGLHKDYFRTRVSADEARAIVQAIESVSVMLSDPAAPPRVVRDPDDDYLVALAVAAAAQAIVTGDRDLLDDVAIEPKAISARDACVELGLLDT